MTNKEKFMDYANKRLKAKQKRIEKGQTEAKTFLIENAIKNKRR